MNSVQDSGGGSAPGDERGTAPVGRRGVPVGAPRARAAEGAAPATVDMIEHPPRPLGPTPELLAEVGALGTDRWLVTQLNPAGIPDADRGWQAPPTAPMSARRVRGRRGGVRLDAMVAYAQATLARQSPPG
ncbi:hypothetical protein [Actinokineospora globicatena]|uniref:Uncharacterized protein n=1 Tax=Actinokineospora globicatena TaxID=103729 RepID=A0A9W6VBU5_9PSEU|nr:hypothetical protein [Actinokineospora globicatena]MCP2305797.1 hypothetical protein [Actinokineospora globicatena]GLW80347.1 hypothetical protein Aglo01_48280 [Actinokineospora globicatena]GLW87175.1 hypothetical protein Aglo02_48140 [Actinokineospora globicatena]GLW93531.1 hypothetical protein Aglo03_43470 [Actinokineospora globicatena]